MRDPDGFWAGTWLVFLVVFVPMLVCIGFGIYTLKTTRYAAYEFQLVLVPVEGGTVLTPMSTGVCAMRVPK